MEIQPAPVPSRNPLAEALAEAQKELKNPAKDRENPYFNSRYATLDALQDASRTILAKHGLSITQVCLMAAATPMTSERVATEVTDKEGNVTRSEGYKIHPFLWCLKTVLMHTSGATIESVMPLVMATKGAQQFGGEITYMRRYAYAAILNMTADEDDDGNTAEGKEVPERTAAKEPEKKKRAKKDDLLESTPVQQTVTTPSGPVDPEAGKPDEIPGLEPEVPPEWLKEPGVGGEPTLLEQVRDHLHTDGFKEEELMTLIRTFKLTRAVMLDKVEDKVLQSVLSKWETVQTRIRDARKGEAK